jgi:hypothetical protein
VATASQSLRAPSAKPRPKTKSAELFERVRELHSGGASNKDMTKILNRSPEEINEFADAGE